MDTIRVVWGSGTGPTALAAHDAALAAANVHDYNLRRVSSVIPAGARVERAGTAPDLGPVGGALTVVEARATVGPGGTVTGPDGAVHTDAGGRTVTAGLGWASAEDGRGIFYEGSGADPDAVRTEIERGLAAGRDLREWTAAREEQALETADAAVGGYATAVVLAVYGRSDPIL
jgi:arginine decarboxylase